MNEKKAALFFVFTVVLFFCTSASPGTIGEKIYQPAGIVMAAASAAIMMSVSRDDRSYLEVPDHAGPEVIKFYETDENGNLYCKRYHWENGKITESRHWVASRNQPVFLELYSQLLLLLRDAGRVLVVTDHPDQQSHHRVTLPGIIVANGSDTKQGPMFFSGSTRLPLKIAQASEGAPLIPATDQKKRAASGRTRKGGADRGKIGKPSVKKTINGAGVRKRAAKKKHLKKEDRRKTSHQLGRQLGLTGTGEANEFSDISIPIFSDVDALLAHAEANGIPANDITHAENPPEYLTGLSKEDWDGIVAFYELVTGDAIVWVGQYSHFQNWLRDTVKKITTTTRFRTTGEAYVSLCLQHMAMEYSDANLKLNKNAEQFICGEMNDFAQLQIYLERNSRITFQQLLENQSELVCSLSADLLSRTEKDRENFLEQLRIATERSSNIKPEDFLTSNL